MTCHKLVQASSATRAPGYLASFPWSKIDKHIPLRPDVAGRGQKPVYEKTEREWRGLYKPLDCVSEFLWKAKELRLLGVVSMIIWIKLYSYFHEAVRASYSEIASTLCMCEVACV